MGNPAGRERLEEPGHSVRDELAKRGGGGGETWQE